MLPLEKASRLHPRICPTVGAGSSRFSRRFPRPTSPQAAWIFFVATWRTASRFIARPSGLPGVCSDVACRYYACHIVYVGLAEVFLRSLRIRVYKWLFVEGWHAW